MLASLWPGEPDEARLALTSPYRGERRRAVEALASDSDPAERAREMLSSDRVRERAAGVEMLTRVMGSEPGLFDGAALLARLVAESDPDVRRRLGRLIAEQTEASLATLAGGDVRVRMAGTRVRGLFEERMGDGRVPGFYDGQFTELWPITSELPETLLGFARDESLHYVVRAMSVMALHEMPTDTMEKDFASILLDVDFEFNVTQDSWFDPRPRHPGIIELRRRADLSRYARFSLAKAGKTGAILLMIRRMDAEIESQRHRMVGRANPDEDWTTVEDHVREWLRGLLFETGYFYQQFDDYESAAARYRELVQRYPDSGACQNAYYNLACVASIQEDLPRALRYLGRAIDLGFTDAEWLLEDRDLSPLWGRPDFERLVARARTGRPNEGGREWLEKVLPHVPAGVGFHDLPVEEKERILRGIKDELGEAERRELLQSLEPAEAERLRRVWDEGAR